MVERAIYRKLSKGTFLLISYLLSILFLVLNLVYIILSIILIVFSILSLIAESNYSNQYKENFKIQLKDDFLSTTFFFENNYQWLIYN